ncbi:MAG TPA: PDZ domain-containing protein [Rudaea sp.]|nr:PDZ domain-containing protein [Rudaea sp.]
MCKRFLISIFLFGFSVVAFATGSAANGGATPANAQIGVLVDSTSAAHARDGLRVLGATPGSVADQLGLRPGDLLVDVNGTSLSELGADANGRALAWTTFNARIASLPPSVPLRLSVVRDGISLAMNAPLHGRLNAGAMALATAGSDEEPAVAATGADGCGRISTFDAAPRSKQQYHARILLLDGTTPGPSGQQNYRVKPGVHELLVAEDIPTLEMGVGAMASLRRHTQKKLTVTVQPNTTYMVGAQLHLDKASQFNTGNYWDPVVWREIPEVCH